jgi:hypothetical protein
MTASQNKFYFRLWGILRKVDPKADRKAIHAELGLPESHLAFTQAHFDRWKGYVLSKAQPANVRAQIRQETMPQIRKQTFIRQLLAALDEPEEYAEAVLSRMQRNRKLASTGAGRLVTMETLGVEDLEKVMIALKKECCRRWRTKDELLGEIRIFRHENDLDEATAIAAVMQALCRTTLPPLQDLAYEPLLVTLGTLRTLANGTLTLSREPRVSPPATADFLC